jgi:hypothetical protein
MIKIKRVIYEVLAGAFLIGMAVGAYDLIRISHNHKKSAREIDSAFYAGCITSQDSTKRVYDAGLEGYMHIDYSKIPENLKKEYVKKKLEKKLE